VLEANENIARVEGRSCFPKCSKKVNLEDSDASFRDVDFLEGTAEFDEN